MLRRILAIAASLAVALAFMAFGERRAMHREHIPLKDEGFTEWNGYVYRHKTATRFTVEGQVAAISPNGGVFCSGPFKGGPGSSFVVEVGTGSRRRAVSLSAFGAGDVEAALHSLRVGSRVRLTGTEGPVSILRDGVVVQTVEPSGHWWTMNREYVVVVEHVDPA